jgi:hypothetical protein
MAGRLDFDERRQRAFEGVVQYRKPERGGGGRHTPERSEGGNPRGQGGQPGQGQQNPPREQQPRDGATPGADGQAAPGAPGEDGVQRSRRRRRRRRRVPGAGMPQNQNAQPGGGSEPVDGGGEGSDE